ncbi:MAG: 2-oxoacid:ferredoxin oxidoreductase subunit beta, partial [Clostridia bacterium]|nr:2-oxoacid:ferredoxin oxidoreductase subunit beta [Clostridia bacterium]
AMGAGATYAARGSAYHVPQTTKLIQDGIAHKGFALIDCMAVCPTYYGRKNKKGDAVKMMTWQKENVVMKAKADTMTPEELEGKAVIGCFRNEPEVPEYTAEYTKLIERLKKA